jgi:16S rRNA G1207 methylase RsmC
LKKTQKPPVSIGQLRKDIVFTEQLRGKSYQFHTTWGLFSPKSVDAGTQLLLKHIQIEPDDRAIDLGCGYGPLGMVVAQEATNGHCVMVDKDFVAIEYANANLQRNQIKNAQAVLSDGLKHIADQRFTLALSNLPAKTNKEHYHLFFYDIHQCLETGGRVYVVVINGLRHYIKREFTEIFGNYTKVKQGTTYTVAMAVKTMDR